MTLEEIIKEGKQIVEVSKRAKKDAEKEGNTEKATLINGFIFGVEWILEDLEDYIAEQEE